MTLLRPCSRSVRLRLACCGLLVSAFAAAAEDQTRSLFNGRDLTGWTGDPALWSVEDGAITGRTRAEAPLAANTFLVWEGGEVRNFELRLQFRFLGAADRPAGNSGVQYRSRVLDRPTWVVGGYQGDMNAAGNYTGLLYEEKGRGILARPGQRVRITAGDGDKPGLEVVAETTPPGEIASSLRLNEWNDYRVVAEGNHLRHFVNGRLATDVVDLDGAKAAASGIIALQLHVGPPMTVQFRDLELRQLP